MNKVTRRDLLGSGIGVGIGTLMAGVLPTNTGSAQPPASNVLQSKVELSSSVQRYKATVPDTLDLAERAKWAMHGIANTVDPDDEFQMWFDVFWNNDPPYLKHSGCDVECTPKFLDAMTLLRLASGSREYVDIEQGMEKALLSYLGPKDGLYYALYKPHRKWHMSAYADTGYQTKEEDYAVPGSGGMMLATMVLRNELGMTPCEDQMRSLARGLEKIAVKKDDYAYYPEGGSTGHPFTCTRSGWKSTKEPTREREGGEGSILGYQGYQLRGLSMWAQRSSNQQALDFAGKLARFVMKSKFWGHPADPTHVIGTEQGHVDSHFHARSIALRGLLEYGLVAGDARVCDFVRSAYEYLRSWGISPIGQIPCWPERDRATMEGCLLGDLVAMTVKMSRAGIGDYWDDADRVIRNHLAEAQCLRRDLLERVMQNSSKKQPQGHPGQVSTDKVLDRMMGIFGSYLMPTCIVSDRRGTDPTGGGRIMQCCTANAARGIAYAWDGILDTDGDRVQVNLLLNRASPWLDVNSYLPYEGKVVLLNKTARRVAVRIPSWINRREIRSSVNGASRQADWLGAYQVFDDLKPGDVIQVEFPVLQETVHLSGKMAPVSQKQNTLYAITFRGNTVVDITPRDESPTAYPMYHRDSMKAGPAPLKTIERCVTAKIAKW
jgi:hypothetical protein